MDGVLLSSTEENGVDDAEVSLSLTIGTINTFFFICLFIYLYIYPLMSTQDDSLYRSERTQGFSD